MITIQEACFLRGCWHTFRKSSAWNTHYQRKPPDIVSSSPWQQGYCVCQHPWQAGPRGATGQVESLYECSLQGGYNWSWDGHLPQFKIHSGWQALLQAIMCHELPSTNIRHCPQCHLYGDGCCGNTQARPFPWSDIKVTKKRNSYSHFNTHKKVITL